MSKIQILIADDNIDFCNILFEYLNHQNDMEVVGVAHNGVDTIVKIADLAPDLVILDIIMPKLDGLGVLESVGKMKLAKRPLLLILTAVGNETVTRKAATLGASYLLLKPFDMEALLSIIRDLTSINQTESNQVAAPCPEHSSQHTSLEAKISTLLHEIGIPPHIKGYQYIRDSILMAYHDVESIQSITKNIYPVLARRYKAKTASIERAMRHAIGLAWEKGHFHRSGCFPPQDYTIRPSNSEFISKAVTFLQEQAAFV